MLIFYSVFYIILAIFFAIMMHFWIGTLSDELPRWTLGESRIGENPGLGFRPVARRTQQGSLIWYDTKNDTDIEYWTNALDTFIERKYGWLIGRCINCKWKRFHLINFTHALAYQNAVNESFIIPNQVHCTPNQPPPKGSFCKVELNLGNCTSLNHFGYVIGQPCVFLKLNKVCSTDHNNKKHTSRENPKMITLKIVIEFRLLDGRHSRTQRTKMVFWNYQQICQKNWKNVLQRCLRAK